MSADLLRHAATKLRETAAEAPAGPWRVTLNFNRKHPKVIAGATWHQPDGKKEISLKHPGNLGQAQWNALTHPGVAEPLATWLVQHADEHSTYDCDRPDCAAVDFAHDILGEANS